MFEWLGNKLIQFWKWLVPFTAGALVGMELIVYLHMESENDRLKEQLPNVREYDVKQLPPQAKNLRGLGNRWILFDMEINNEKRTFIFRRAYYRDQPDILTLVR